MDSPQLGPRPQPRPPNYPPPPRLRQQRPSMLQPRSRQSPISTKARPAAFFMLPPSKLVPAPLRHPPVAALRPAIKPGPHVLHTWRRFTKHAWPPVAPTRSRFISPVPASAQAPVPVPSKRGAPALPAPAPTPAPGSLYQAPSASAPHVLPLHAPVATAANAPGPSQLDSDANFSASSSSIPAPTHPESAPAATEASTRAPVPGPMPPKPSRTRARTRASTRAPTRTSTRVPTSKRKRIEVDDDDILHDLLANSSNVDAEANPESTADADANPESAACVESLGLRNWSLSSPVLTTDYEARTEKFSTSDIHADNMSDLDFLLNNLLMPTAGLSRPPGPPGPSATAAIATASPPSGSTSAPHDGSGGTPSIKMRLGNKTWVSRFY